jgi:hypothetical protein
MLLLACAGTGLAEFVTDKSAEFPTCTLADALLLTLFGSLVVSTTDAVWVMVEPEATFVLTLRTKLKFAVALSARLAMVQDRVPTLHVHPAGPVKDTAVVLRGTVSLNVMVLAAAGPPFVTVWT